MTVEGLKWSRLIAGAGIGPEWDGMVDPVITSVVEDSRHAGPGSCFVALQGLRADGNAFVDHALAAGASAVISERTLALPACVPGLQVANARGLAGRLAAVLYGLDKVQRDGRLKVVGITGTNGKSTFCYLLRAILQAAGFPTALFGTIQYDLLSRRVQASMTTPPPAALMAYLAEAATAGATHVVMEASSHALDQGRCDGIRFTVGVFSNLSGDHLDYHADMTAYLQAKKRLFDGLDDNAVAVVNGDDDASERMIADCRARVMRYGVLADSGLGPQSRGLIEQSGSPPAPCSAAGQRAPAHADLAGVYARVHELNAGGARFDLVIRCPGSQIEPCQVVSPLIGRHNVENCLAAAGAAIALGIPLQTVAAGLSSVECVPGRLQRVGTEGAEGGPAREPGFTVLVDYAHTDDALENVLSALRPLTKGRLIVLFGCGGDRDRTKRPRMAAAAARWADRILVTSDNSRTEDTRHIIDEIMTGFAPQQVGRVSIEPDRRRAIARAIAMADRGDVVLLAGKGHEAYQEMGHERMPFDDAKVAAEALRQTKNDE